MRNDISNGIIMVLLSIPLIFYFPIIVDRLIHGWGAQLFTQDLEYTAVFSLDLAIILIWLQKHDKVS